MVQATPNEYQGILGARTRQYRNGTILVILNYVNEDGSTTEVIVDVDQQTIFDGELETETTPIPDENVRESEVLEEEEDEENSNTEVIL